MHSAESTAWLIVAAAWAALAVAVVLKYATKRSAEFNDDRFPGDW